MVRCVRLGAGGLGFAERRRVERLGVAVSRPLAPYGDLVKHIVEACELDGVFACYVLFGGGFDGQDGARVAVRTACGHHRGERVAHGRGGGDGDGR
ncbi:hypothetical protein ES708_22250 [subsurface metagenome]